MLIKDGGTLVLGGLIQDSVSNSEQSVPLLGKIPLLGELFRTRNNQKTKTNFLIFLQPHILRDDVQAAIETDAKYNYMRERAAPDRTRQDVRCRCALHAGRPAAAADQRTHDDHVGAAPPIAGATVILHPASTERAPAAARQSAPAARRRASRARAPPRRSACRADRAARLRGRPSERAPARMQPVRPHASAASRDADAAPREPTASAARLPFTFARRHGVLVRARRGRRRRLCLSRAVHAAWRSPRRAAICACR